MNKIAVYENSYVKIDDSTKDLFGDLIGIGYQIKNELGLMYSPVQSVSADKIYIGNIVGNLTLNTTNLVIYPKYMGDFGDTKGVMKKLFSRTLKCATKGLGSTVFFYRNNAINEQNDFFDMLAKYFLDITQQAVKKSKICLYEERIEKVRTIKGRILVQKQLSGPIANEKTWCKFKRLSDNNIYNQLLGWCCRYLSRMASSFDIKRKLLMLSREYQQQTDMLNPHDVKLLKVPRQFSEYDESIAMAKSLYLDSCSKKEKLDKGNRVCGYAINMERSFENIVCYYLRIAAHRCGFRHKPQASKQLAAAPEGAYLAYEVRPDNLITKGSNDLIVDAKYKALSLQGKTSRKPSHDDFYQMISSCIAYECHEAVLIYPETVNFPYLSWKTDKTVNGFQITVKSEAINISVDDESLINRMEEIIMNTDFYEEDANG